ncbi:MAG: hypothetical protein M0011_07140 [Elusimicrobia bacterium]|nr:hypothetical protein [Elusimicrobiota bacterium]
MRCRYALTLLLGLLGAAYLPAPNAVGEELQQGSGFFDGAGHYKALQSGTSPSEMSPEALKAELKKHIVFDDHGSSREREGYERMLTRLMNSPTARQEARKFVEDGREITFSFADMTGTTIATVNGRKEVWGPRGVTHIREVPPGVQINKEFLDYDTDVGVGTFAHETFGHAVSASTLSGADALVNTCAITEEENARMIGWLVRTELGVPPEAEIWDYAANPDRSMQDLTMGHPYYALQLTTDEMQDPLPVYQERLDKVSELQANIPKRQQNLKNWTRIVDHFVNAHKMDEASFRNIRDSIANSSKALPNSEKMYADIKKALEQRISYLSTEKGKATLEVLRRGASSQFLKDRDAVILANRRKLDGLLAGQSAETTAPPPQAGQVTWEQLKEMLNKDRQDCQYGGVK